MTDRHGYRQAPHAALKTNERTERCGLTFDDWYHEVDRLVLNTAGVGVEDLADGPSWDRWNDETSPDEYADEVLDAAGFPFGING